MWSGDRTGEKDRKTRIHWNSVGLGLDHTHTHTHTRITPTASHTGPYLSMIVKQSLRALRAPIIVAVRIPQSSGVHFSQLHCSNAIKYLRHRWKTWDTGQRQGEDAKHGELSIIYRNIKRCKKTINLFCGSAHPLTRTNSGFSFSSPSR